MAPPKSSSFSVSVVFPASGCEMMPKVRRRAISSKKFIGQKYMDLINQRLTKSFFVLLFPHGRTGYFSRCARQSHRLDAQNGGTRKRCIAPCIFGIHFK